MFFWIQKLYIFTPYHSSNWEKKQGTLAEGTSKLLLLGFWVGSGIFNFSGGPIQIPKNGSSSLAISIKLCFLVGATTEDFFLTGSVLLELPMKLLIIFHGVFCFLSCKYVNVILSSLGHQKRYPGLFGYTKRNGLNRWSQNCIFRCPLKV